jgi:dTDP-4-amino-4,6-dideoxygalactose transaminase
VTGSVTRAVPALLGGPVRFPVRVPVTRPTLTVDDSLMADIRAVLESGRLTCGARVAAFEQAVAEYLGVPHVVAVNSCTTGLVLVLQALGLRGEVILPSFTFMATGHAVLWNALTPAFADCDPHSYTLDPASVERAATGHLAAILAVHTFGVSCDVAALGELAAARGVPLVIDAAHAFGARYPNGAMVGGKATAEVFSLSPTKNLTIGEGGLVTTRSASLAAHLRVARDYGNPGDYHARFAGLNGRVTEVNAAIGLASLRDLPARLERRTELAGVYRRRLAAVPGLSFQTVPPGARSSYKDLVVAVDAGEFGLSRNRLAAALAAEGVDTRRYFDPPLHRQRAYSRRARLPAALPHTDRLAATLLTLPLYTDMDSAVVERICDIVEMAHAWREDLAGES